MALDNQVQNYENMAKAADAFRQPQAAIVQPVSADYLKRQERDLRDRLADFGLRVLKGGMDLFVSEAHAGGNVDYKGIERNNQMLLIQIKGPMM